MNHDHYSDAYLSKVLTETKTIALVGASPNEARPSHGVMRFLLGRGYKVTPVNPGQAGKEILGQPVAARLADLAQPVDRALEAFPRIIGLRDRPLKALAVYKGRPEGKEPLGVELPGMLTLSYDSDLMPFVAALQAG